MAQLELALENLSDSLNWPAGELEAIIDSIEAYANRQSPSETAIDQMLNCSAGTDLTEREAGYIQAIGQALTTASDSADLMNRLIQIEYDIVNEDWENGEDCAKAVISVAKHSFHVWHSMFDEWAIDRAIYTLAEDANAEFWSPWPKDHWKTKVRVSVHSTMAACWWEPGMEACFPSY
jgi:hypothetical protein